MSTSAQSIWCWSLPVTTTCAFRGTSSLGDNASKTEMLRQTYTVLLAVNLGGGRLLKGFCLFYALFLNFYLFLVFILKNVSVCILGIEKSGLLKERKVEVIKKKKLGLQVLDTDGWTQCRQRGDPCIHKVHQLRFRQGLKVTEAGHVHTGGVGALGQKVRARAGPRGSWGSHSSTRLPGDKG